MKSLGKRSISSLLKRLITLVWYLEFLLLLTPPLVFMDDDGIRYSWPVTLESAEIKPAINPTSDRINHFKLLGRPGVVNSDLEQTLSFEDSTFNRRLLQTLHNLVYIGLIMFVTWQLKSIFSGLSDNQPFTNNNGTRIKWIAFSVVFLVFFDILEAILHRMYTSSTVVLSGAAFDKYSISFDFRTFMLGLLLLILAEVFRKGYEYQADSESIL
jgi:hypothetical protein